MLDSELESLGYRSFDLGSEGREFVATRLARCGHELAQAVLEQIDLAKGDVSVMLPRVTAAEQLLKFEQGGVGGVAASSGLLVELIGEEYADNRSAIVVAEDALGAPGDPHVRDPNAVPAFVGDHVYYLERASAGQQAVEDVVGSIGAVYTEHHFVTILPEFEIVERELDASEIKSLAQGVELISVMAYDDEARVIWRI